jgi:Fe2+ or Zn2+ uptake regulation protein
MTHRHTSILAYHAIKENGLLSHRRLQVYECLFHRGPLTANEVTRYYQKKNPRIKDGAINGRFSELKYFGLIKEVGFKDDIVSGHKNILWDVTPNFHTDNSKKLSRKDRIEQIKDSIRPWIPRPERDHIFQSIDKLK